MTDDRENASRTAVADALAALNSALARDIGAEKAAQVAEYIEHHEFGLALELIIALALRHGLDGGVYDAGIGRLARAMEMEDSEYVSEWRKRPRGA